VCVAVRGAATVSDGHLVALHPDPAHSTGQALSVKEKAEPVLVHHPERLLHPLRVAGWC
jgi:anaerobic selenocysteine-containing dehydrogenase